MDVFLLPVTAAPPGHEPAFALYCDPEPVTADAGPTTDRDAPASSRWGRFVQRFHPKAVWRRAVSGFLAALAEGEAEQRRQETGVGALPQGGRLARWVKRKLAEAVAEQRLLWRLRSGDGARLVHPDTLAAPRAVAVTTAEMRRDFEKHRRWFWINVAIVIVQSPLAFVPGPNFFAYYFIFRAVGHYFAMHGARRGLDPSVWTAVPSGPLTDLGAALSLEPAARAIRINEIAATLGLERLPAFMRRVTAA